MKLRKMMKMKILDKYNEEEMKKKQQEEEIKKSRR